MTAKIHQLINFFEQKPITSQDLIDLTEKRIKEIKQEIENLEDLNDHKSWRKRKSLTEALGLNKQIQKSFLTISGNQ